MKSAFALGGIHIARSPIVGRALVFVALTTSFALAGLTLISRGRQDRRAVSLGVFFLLVGSSFADPLLVATTTAASGGRMLFGALASIQVAAFQAYYFWQFARDFPRRIGPYVRQDVALICSSAALAIGVLLFAGNFLIALLPPHNSARPLLSLMDRHILGSLYWPVLILFGLPVLPYIAWSARRASREERRRAAVLLAGVCLGIAPAMLLPLVELASPSALAFDVTPLGEMVVGALVYPPLLSIPFTTAYAIIVHNALDVRLIVRKALRYAIMKSSVIFGTLIPFVILAGIVYYRRNERVVDVAGGRIGIVVLLLVVGGVFSSIFRPRLLSGLDRRFFREQYNAHKILHELEVQPGTSHAVIAARVAQAVDDALHLRSVSLLMMDAAKGVLSTPAHGIRPLSRHARLVTDYLSRDRVLEVDWSDDTSWAHSIPVSEVEWLMEADSRLIVAVHGNSKQLLGALLVGEKKSELPFSHEDRVLLTGVASVVGRAIQIPLESREPSVVVSDPQKTASECPSCGLLDTPDQTLCRECRTTLQPSAVPCLLSGKYEPLQRIGSGGMGVVFKAFDRSLSRNVALKTLPRAAPFGAARMRREARAMAAVSHPNLGAIYASESWRGTPMLIVEFLAGGTLSERLRSSPLSVDEALGLAECMGSALIRLHRAGILHRDIKPANIGYDSDGTPKLLDFGLAWMLEAAAVAPPLANRIGSVEALSELSSIALTATGQIVGTLPYLSPESVNGEPISPLVDLWALSMVIYESLAGTHPLAHGNAEGMLKRILCDDVQDIRAYAPSVPETFAVFLRDSLSRELARRPQSAHAWHNQFVLAVLTR
ncbi:MAG: protein kinase [Gemmatimonadota bacterium]|nr:protein kinase [Gemmatimonadota bacterium]